MRNKNETKRAFEKFLKKRFSLALQQRLVLLLRREDKQIRDFRNSWKIPPNGFKDEIEWKNWWDNPKKIIPEKVKDVE